MLHNIWRAFERIPFLSVVLLAALFQLIGEQFPSSTFRMYSELSDHQSVFYMTTADGERIAQEAVFDLRAARMRKMIKADALQICEQEKMPLAQARVEAARRLLADLIASAPSNQRRMLQERGLVLHETKVHLTGGRLLESTSEVARVGPEAGAR